MPRCRALVLTAGIMSLVACAPPNIDACVLLSSEDIASILEVQISAGSRNDDRITKDGAYSSTCVWKIILPPREVGQSASPRSSPPRLVILNAMAWPLDGQPSAFLDEFREASKSGVIGHALEPLELGEESFWWGDGVAVRSGKLTFGISILMPEASGEWRRARTEDLAARIVTET